MADTQGEGVWGPFEGNTGVTRRPRKRDKAWCLLCLKSGRKSKLQLFQIGINEAMYLCSNETCPYPLLMTEDLHGSVVTRELSELKVSSPQESSSGRFHPMNNFPTSMPIVVPVEVQKIPTIQKEDTIPKRTPNLLKDIPDDSLLQFRLWMRDKKRTYRNNSFPNEDASNAGKNGDPKERADLSVGKRSRVRSSHLDADSETESVSKTRADSQPSKLPSKTHRHFSTPSIRKIDKTLMEASGVSVDKKFEPFKITPKNEIPKPASPVPQESELIEENKIINNEDPLVEPTIQTLPNINTESQSQNNILENNNTNDIPIESSITNHMNGEDPTTLVQMTSIEPQMLSPEQWHHQQQIPPPHMAIQNGHVPDSLYHSPIIPPSLYLHNNYPLMPPHPQYNNLIPPPSSYHNMATSLQSPLSPIPHNSNDYVISPQDPSQFYYTDNMYPDYTDQWEQLDLTNMLDSINTNQFDPVLGILTPGSTTDQGLYDLMDPSTMATLEVPNNLDPPPSSLPLINSSAHTQATEQRVISAELIDIVSTIDSNHRCDEAGNFNNNQESPLSSYQSPLSQGDNKSDSDYMSMVCSPTLNLNGEMKIKSKYVTLQSCKLPRIKEVD